MNIVRLIGKHYIVLTSRIGIFNHFSKYMSFDTRYNPSLASIESLSLIQLRELEQSLTDIHVEPNHVIVIPKYIFSGLHKGDNVFNVIYDYMCRTTNLYTLRDYIERYSKISNMDYQEVYL